MSDRCELISNEFLRVMGGGVAMERIRRMLPHLALCGVPVLITGEPGVGKSIVAETIGQLSDVIHGGDPLLGMMTWECDRSVDGALCGEELIGELTGEVRRVVFLRHVDAIPVSLQRTLVPLLRRPGLRTQCVASIDVADPFERIEAGTFDESLYHCLNAGRVDLPPLREHAREIPAIATVMLDGVNRLCGTRFSRIGDDAAAVLMAYDWAGNRYELCSALRRAAVMAGLLGGSVDMEDVDGDGNVVGRTLAAAMLPPVVRGETPQESASARFRSRMTFDEMVVETVRRGLTELDDGAELLYQRLLDPFERELIRQVFEETRRVRTLTAQRLGINRNTLHRKLNDYGIESEG